MKTWHVVAGAGVAIAAGAVIFWPKSALASTLLSWKNTGPMTIKPKAASPIVYKGAGNRLVATDPDELVVTEPSWLTRDLGVPILDLDDPNSVPLY